MPHVNVVLCHVSHTAGALSAAKQLFVNFHWIQSPDHEYMYQGYACLMEVCSAVCLLLSSFMVRTICQVA